MPQPEFRDAIATKCHKGELIPCCCVFRLLSFWLHCSHSLHKGLFIYTLHHVSQTRGPLLSLSCARARLAPDSLVLVFSLEVQDLFL